MKPYGNTGSGVGVRGKNDMVMSEGHAAGHMAQVPRLETIRPGMPVPDTVLVARMSDGSYLLMGWPELEPKAFLNMEDAGELSTALHSSFGISGTGNA